MQMSAHSNSGSLSLDIDLDCIASVLACPELQICMAWCELQGKVIIPVKRPNSLADVNGWKVFLTGCELLQAADLGRSGLLHSFSAAYKRRKVHD